MQGRAAKWLAALLHVASIVACGIVLCSFLLFAVDQAATASDHQSQMVGGSAPATQTARPTSLRDELDRIDRNLVSPFAGVVSTDSEWGLRAEETVIALLIYGFAVSLAVRWLKFRRL